MISLIIRLSCVNIKKTCTVFLCFSLLFSRLCVKITHVTQTIINTQLRVYYYFQLTVLRGYNCVGFKNRVTQFTSLLSLFSWNKSYYHTSTDFSLYTRVVRKLLRQYRIFDKYVTHLLHYWQKQ